MKIILKNGSIAEGEVKELAYFVSQLRLINNGLTSAAKRANNGKSKDEIRRRKAKAYYKAHKEHILAKQREWLARKRASIKIEQL